MQESQNTDAAHLTEVRKRAEALWLDEEELQRKIGDAEAQLQKLKVPVADAANG